MSNLKVSQLEKITNMKEDSFVLAVQNGKNYKMSVKEAMNSYIDLSNYYTKEETVDTINTTKTELQTSITSNTDLINTTKNELIGTENTDGTTIWGAKKYTDDLIKNLSSRIDSIVAGGVAFKGVVAALPSPANNGDLVIMSADYEIDGKTYKKDYEYVYSNGTWYELGDSDKNAKAIANVKNVIEDNELVTATALTNLDTRVNTVEDFLSNQIIPISYTDLKSLRDNAQLVPGQQYRITDYQCTTAQENTRSANHQFDIIVTADAVNTLNEVARAAKHDGDTYFANCDLNAWKIWYSLDNDISRFAWADSTNGKGVIYRMIDEWNNDVPYDFKNIQFKRYILNAADAIATDVAKAGELDVVKEKLKVMSHRIHTSLWYYGEYVTDVYPNAEEGKKYVPFGDIMYNAEGPSVLCPINEENFGWFYTFSDASFYDITVTLQENVNNNVIKSNKLLLVISPEEGRCLFERQKGICINDIIFIGDQCLSNTFGNDCYFNTFSDNCYSNTFGFSCQSNSFSSSCFNNSFGSNCQSNSFGSNCQSNSFREGCSSNTFSSSCSNNTFGFSCQSNSFREGCSFNTFSSYCSMNSFGSSCSDNTFGSDCQSNTFGSYCSYNSFGFNCNSNTFGEGCSSNTFSSYCSMNSFGSSCQSNTFGSGCSRNTFGSSCYFNTFGSGCSIKFASDKDATTKYNYYRYNHFGDGCKYILFKGVETASSSAQIQNYNFSQGLQGTSDAYLDIDGGRNLSYEVKVAKNSNGELKIYCEADLIR